jgi:hypothetical protein
MNMDKATERIVVQVTHPQKREIVENANRLGLNISELMRQAAHGFAPSCDGKELNQAIERVNASTQEAHAALNEALTCIAESNLRIAAMTYGKRS